MYFIYYYVYILNDITITIDKVDCIDINEESDRIVIGTSCLEGNEWRGEIIVKDIKVLDSKAEEGGEVEVCILLAVVIITVMVAMKLNLVLLYFSLYS